MTIDLEVTLADLYNGKETTIAVNKRVGPFLWRFSNGVLRGFVLLT